MTKRQIKDIAASVRQRLYNNSKQTGRPFNDVVLRYFGMERFLYRLARSRYANRFVLKGALMLRAWRAPASRPTRDIDLLGRTNNSVDAIVQIVRDVCVQPVEPDGMDFDPASVKGQVIDKDADYGGVRVVFLGFLQQARVPVQIDIGFGDVIVPKATLIEYPTILDLPPPRLYGYSRETVVAEKFEAMVKLGLINSRMKDFFDVWLLSDQFDFDGRILATAVTKTFRTRKTEIRAEPVALTPAFSNDPAHKAQWRAFLGTTNVDPAPQELGVLVAALREFLLPVAAAVSDTAPFNRRWRAPGPWKQNA